MSISKFVGLTSALSATVFLVSCTSAPTYGTGKRSDAQLLEDVSNIASLAPKKKEKIDYKPRPSIVKPASIGELPAPQTAYAKSEQWPESPEERRARIRAEATANQDNPFYRSSVVQADRGQAQDNSELSEEEKQSKFREQLALKRGSYEGRRYLSDPPTEYKQPLGTAPTDELGEDESKKERRRLKAAKKKGGFKIGDLWPF